jgi:A/G-specific adenine glycosylase
VPVPAPRDAPFFPDADRFRAAVLGWYDAHGRHLNFRARRDPYAVLVSELMAQQTQISRVEPAWSAWLDRFPTVEALAAAPTADVLRAWAGMGYNRRARNLQRAARMVVDEFGGRFPEKPEDLEWLPGVGPYTARAVAAIAFGARVGAVDTNVRRVLGRVIGGWGGLPPGDLQRLADELVPAGRAAEWTHALMDVGALHCRPLTPRCSECPIRAWCRAASAGTARSDPSPPGRRQSASSASPTGSRAPSVPFRATSRWLRGRLVDLARGVEGDGWIRVDLALDPHDAGAVGIAARKLAGEGLLEIHPSEPTLARLPR